MKLKEKVSSCKEFIIDPSRSLFYIISFTLLILAWVIADIDKSAHLYSFLDHVFNKSICWYSGACRPATLLHGVWCGCARGLWSLLQSNIWWYNFLHMQVFALQYQVWWFKISIKLYKYISSSFHSCSETSSRRFATTLQQSLQV